MKLNDALVKVDQNLEAVIRKVQKQGFDLDPKFECKVFHPDGDSKSD